MQVARINLLDWNTASPSPTRRCARRAERTTRWSRAARNGPRITTQSEAPVAQMVALSGLPERTFKRRFAQATGMSPLEYVHTLRLEEAKQMLEAGDAPVEAIAVEVGYQRRELLQPAVPPQGALTPAQYRRRFGSLRGRLREAAAAAPPPTLPPRHADAAPLAS